MIHIRHRPQGEELGFRAPEMALCYPDVVVFDADKRSRTHNHARWNSTRSNDKRKPSSVE